MKRIALLSCVCLVLTAPLAAADTIKIGSKSFTESVILGELIRQLLESNGIRAEHRADLGGTPVVYGALRSGDLHVYVEYTGTLTQELLASRRPVNEAQAREFLAEDRIVLGPRLGFVNNYELGVPRDIANRHNLETISDLAKHPQLRIALSSEFIGRKDGWPLLASRYSLPHTPTGMNHETALAGLIRGKTDVTDLYSTDAEIAQYDLVKLKDDRSVLPLYHAVLLYRADLPANIVSVLRSLENRIDTERMMRLNANVRVNRISEKSASAEYLNETFGLSLPTQESRWGRIVKGMVWATWQHLVLVLVSLGFAVAVAIPLGVLAYKVPWLGKYILGVVAVVQTIPSMALLVFLLTLLPLGTWPALVALLMYSLLPIVRNTYQGLVEIPTALRESAEVIGLPARARLWRIELPLASRSIVSGIKTAAVINVGTATIGAIVGAGGYGQPIMTGIRLMDIPVIMSGAIPAALMALFAQQAFGWLERFVVPRGLRVA